jgi:hypothetical protein
MKPTEAFLKLLERAFVLSHVFKKIPGDVVNRSPKEDRDALKNLTSDEVASLRVEKYELGDRNYDEQVKFSKEKQDFDKLLKK